MMTRTIPSIACAVLTKNEEVNIERCLRSVNWCNQCIVVDSGSTDRTKDLAEMMGARFVTHIQSGVFNIAEQRNWALEHAGITDEWVLFLDADEEVTSELHAAIITGLNADAEFNAYELTPRYLFWGKWLKRTQGFPNWHARLLKRREVRFSGGVWEHFENGAKIARISEPYNHYANSKGLSDWLARHDRYSSWDAQRVVAYLERLDPQEIGTTRKVRLRCWAARFYPLRPFARFVTIYFLRLGFLEGRAALLFSVMYSLYEAMIVVKVWELRRLRRGLSV